MYNISNIYFQQGKLEEAYKLLKESIDIDESLDNKPGLATSYNTMAGLLQSMPKHPEHSNAVYYYVKATNLAKFYRHQEKI